MYACVFPFFFCLFSPLKGKTTLYILFVRRELETWTRKKKHGPLSFNDRTPSPRRVLESFLSLTPSKYAVENILEKRHNCISHSVRLSSWRSIIDEVRSKWETWHLDFFMWRAHQMRFLSESALCTVILTGLCSCRPVVIWIWDETLSVTTTEKVKIRRWRKEFLYFIFPWGPSLLFFFKFTLYPQYLY